MPGKHSQRRKLRGGFLEFLWGKKETPTSSLTTPMSTTSMSTPMPSTTSMSTTPMSSLNTTRTDRFGGKSRSRRMRGGFESNTPTTGLAVYAAPFSGPTAEPHTKVGGRSRRVRRRTGRKVGKKSRRRTHRKH